MASKTLRETAPTFARAGTPRRILGPVALLAALAAALLALAPLASATTSARSASTLLPPKPALTVRGGGGEDGGGEGEGEGEGGQGGEGDGGTQRIARSSAPLGSASVSAGALPAAAPWVVSLQTKLKRLGYFSGPVTGVYGPLTTAAVKRFQQRNALAADGKWGPSSQSMLVRRSAGK